MEEWGVWLGLQAFRHCSRPASLLHTHYTHTSSSTYLPRAVRTMQFDVYYSPYTFTLEHYPRRPPPPGLDITPGTLVRLACVLCETVSSRHSCHYPLTPFRCWTFTALFLTPPTLAGFPDQCVLACPSLPTSASPHCQAQTRRKAGGTLTPDSQAFPFDPRIVLGVPCRQWWWTAGDGQNGQ